MHLLAQSNHIRRTRSGFTLVEMLVVAAILIILTTLTVAAYTTTASADRIRTSARQVQSALGGARDREIKAIKSNSLAKRGLRFLVDATDPTTVTSMTYVGTDGPWTDGQVIVGRPDLDNNGQADSDVVRTVRGWPKFMPDGSVLVTGWKNLYDQGLLVDGSRIRIPAGKQGTWYTVITSRLATGNYSSHGPEILLLTSDYRGSINTTYPTTYNSGLDGEYGSNGQLGKPVDDDLDGMPNNPEERAAPGSDDTSDLNAQTGNQALDYELELKPTVLPGQEPLRLSAGIAIDLFNSVIPGTWFQQRSLARGSALPPANQGWDPGSGNYYYNGWGTWAVEGPDPSNTANDIYRQYSPRMDVMFSGQGTVTGPLATVGMLHFRLADTLDIADSRDPANPQAAPMLYSTLFTQTGYVATFPVNITDSNNDGYADDPLYFARIGGTAGR